MIWMKVFTNIAQVIMRPTVRAATRILAGYMIIWGLFIASPFWDVFVTAAVFRYLHNLSVPEWSIGAIAFTIGLIGVVALRINSVQLAMFFSGCATWYWFVFSIFCIFGDWQSTGGITYLALTTFSLFVYENIRMNNRLSKLK